MRHPKRLILFLLLLVLSLCASASPRFVQGQMLLGTYYDAIYLDSRPKRAEDLPKLDDTTFGGIGSQITPDDGAKGGFLEACQARGKKVIYETNTGSIDDHAKLWKQYTCVAYHNAKDDADLTSTPEKVKAEIAAVRPKYREGMQSFVSVSKSADPKLWKDAADVIGLQLYVWKEGTLRKWYWDYVVAWRAAHKGKLWVHPYLGKSLPTLSQVAPSSGKAPDPVWMSEDYTPAAYNEAAIWCALCAGADDVLFYSAFSINPGYPKSYYRITERWDLLPAYKRMFERIRGYERYFVGKRETFDRGQIVGASWTLPTGEKLTVTVDLHEQLPRVEWAESKPTPPPTAKVEVSREGVVIKAPAGVEFATAP
jgi:hypothetical protein